MERANFVLIFSCYILHGTAGVISDYDGISSWLQLFVVELAGFI